MTTTPKLSPAQKKALRALCAKGFIGSYGGASIATVRVLVDLDLAEWDMWEVSTHYGALGTRGGTARGQTYADWSVVPTLAGIELNAALTGTATPA